MAKPYNSLRVFKSDFLERFSHVHPITPLIVWAPFSAWLFWRSTSIHHISAQAIGILAVIGFFSWTLAEYLLHRYVFHFNAQGPTQERIRFLIHGLHHDDPQDPTRLVMPPVAAAVLCVVLYSFFRALMGPVYVEPYFAGFVIGYLCYDYIHFAVHHFRPRTRVGKMLKHHHMQHHYVAHEARWGVSSPLWDYVFQSLEEKKEKKEEPAV